VRKIAGDKCSIAMWACCAASILHYGVNMGDFRVALHSRLGSGMDVLQASREVRRLGVGLAGHAAGTHLPVGLDAQHRRGSGDPRDARDEHVRLRVEPAGGERAARRAAPGRG
jgi:hypothetical protein